MKMKFTVLSGIFAAALLLSACGASLKEAAPSTAAAATETISEDNTGGMPDTTAPSESESASSLSPYHKIDAKTAKEMMDDGEVTIVDVRRPDEYELGHVPGAVNIPNESISDTQPDGLPELDQTLIVYCRTGVRSKQASEKLEAIGYTAIYDMGGIVDWPYEKVTGTEAE